MTTLNTRNLTEARSLISDITGFDAGEKFTSEQQVREYFTRENMIEMMPEWDTAGTYDDDTLARYAALVIEQGWHCDF